MESAACAAARSNREIFLSGFESFLLVCSCNRMLESCRVGGVSGDGNVYVLFPEDGNAFLYVICPVAVNLCSWILGILGVALAEYFFELSGVVIVLCLNLGESVDS